MHMNHFVVAIGREFGAQGCDIAEKLAEKLGVKLYDRQLVEEAAKKLEMDEHTVQKADEVSAKDIEGLKTTYGIGNFYLSTQVLDAQADIIERVAQNESCIIMGRCADYILRSRPDVLRVFVYADRDIRLRRAIDEYGDLEEHIDEFMHQTDKRRRIYYENYTNQRWGDRENYDLMLNSGDLGIEKCVELICQAVK